jgi:hypothetical protein
MTTMTESYIAATFPGAADAVAFHEALRGGGDLPVPADVWQGAARSGLGPKRVTSILALMTLAVIERMLPDPDADKVQVAYVAQVVLPQMSTDDFVKYVAEKIAAAV